MSIQPVTPAAPRGPERAAAEPAPAPAARAAASAPDTANPVEHAAEIPSEAQLKDAVANINKSLQSLSQDLVFSVDPDSNRTIVKVVDQTTKEVIRQIPTPEALEISKALDTVKGLLIKQTA